MCLTADFVSSPKQLLRNQWGKMNLSGICVLQETVERQLGGEYPSLVTGKLRISSFSQGLL